MGLTQPYLIRDLGVFNFSGFNSIFGKMLFVKNLLLLLFISGFYISLQAQTYWQQQVDYTIEVTLNDSAKSLEGFEKIIYTNQSPDTLTFIWFHLWPNAYKNDKTAFSEQTLLNGNTAFYFSDKEQRGYINQLDFKVNGTTARTTDHPQFIDVIRLELPQPLLPGEKITITTPFHVKLPFNFSRGGYDGSSFQVTQWYPKPAVYDAAGWHPMPYLDQGEFYSEFGSFDVRISVPENYVVAATGELQNEEEIKWLKARRDFAPAAKKNVGKKLTSKTSVKKQHPAAPTVQVPMKTLRFVQQNVHDFAWFANNNFIVDSDSCQLASGKIVEVFSFYTPAEKAIWKNSIQMAKDALRFYSSEVGEYPYDVLSVVQGPQSFGGGMEYPNITIIAPMENERALDITMAHEIGHNWFYGMLASNERDHPWMDEGINSFYENKYRQNKYGQQSNESEVLFQTLATRKKDQPINTRAEDFSTANYALVAYHKTAEWMQLLEDKLTEARFRQMMQQYFQAWQFKHPQPQDFKNIVSTELKEESSAFFRLLDQKGILPDHELIGFKITSPLIGGSLQKYITHPAKNMLLISPALGVNNYDKLMVGGLISNYKLPPSKLQFVVVPLYSFNAKKLNGAGSINYTSVSDRTLNKWRFGTSLMSFSKKQFLDSNGQKVFERFSKLTPSVRLTLGEAPLSTKERFVEARTFFIRERNFSHYVMKSTDNLYYVDSSQMDNRFIAQLSYAVQDYRVLYPYRYELQLQQGEGFYRVNATGNYFFNYAKGGGMNVRVFASKFGYTDKENKLSTSIYQPKLLAVTGEEDYTYSNYFFGRTASFANDGSILKNDGLAAQQIMIRDGGLKLRLDQFEFLQGRSEDWVAALNFNTSLPNRLFPFKLPLKLFFDVGTFSEAWKTGYESSRLLYVGGLQLSLFKDVFNIYAPLIYSNVFRENLKTLPEQNTFFKRLTFSINIQNLSLRQLTDNQISF
jgi:hypothetical protein